MEKERIVSFSSPIIQKNTPIKRLGLSRKRKSRGPECKLHSKIQACSENFIDSSNNSEKCLTKKETRTVDNDNEAADSGVNYDEEINSLKKRIADKEEKLKAFRSMKSNIVQLEELIEVWKNGCKSAFLHFSELLKERQPESIDFKSVLNKLGIWEVMIENFGNDPDISLLDDSQ